MDRQAARKADGLSRRKSTMKMDKYMSLPTITEEEFTENIGQDNFFRRFGNPAIVRTKAGEIFIVMSAELYDRMAKLCDFPGTEELAKHEP